MKTPGNLPQHMINLTIKSITQIASAHGIVYDKNEVINKMKETYKERFNQIFEEMRKDAKEADLFNQMENNKVGALSMQCAKVSLHHGCVEYAKELLGVTI